MASDNQLTREEFDTMAKLLGLTESQQYMDELFSQVRGAFAGNRSLDQLDVSSVEPDMAFIPPSN